MSHRRDTIVIGASTGGVDALRTLLARLPAALPAAVLVVQHRAAAPGQLDAVLSAGPLPVVSVDAPMRLRPGRIHLAPPDRHLIVADAEARPSRGPRENRARPAIDALFRTAAAERGSRVIAVLLTGRLDDGAAGVGAVRRCGGLAIVQEPGEARSPEMPRRAIETAGADHVVPLAAIAPLLAALAGQPVEPSPIPHDVAVEARISAGGVHEPGALDALGEPVPLTCPECGGTLWGVDEGGALVYRCHTGHAASPRALLDSQSEVIERALWVAVRALVERVGTLERLAADAGHRGASAVAAEYHRRAREAGEHAEQARGFLLSLRPPRGEPR